MTVVCSVCREGERRYKCPVCVAPYCSLTCYKSHKEICQTKTQRTGAGGTEQHYIDTGGPPGLTTQQDFGFAHLFPTANTVPHEKLQLLDKSDKLKEILTNPNLREFLLFLDSSEDKAMLMRKAMREPLFLEFVDVCLDTLHPERGKELSDEELMKVIQDKVEEADE